MEIDIEYKGERLSFPVELVKWGYTYRVVIRIKDTEVHFEPDEEGSYRAVVLDNSAGVDPLLLEAIVTQLASTRG